VDNIGLLTIGLAVLLGVVVWKSSTAIIRALSTPPPEIDPADTVPVDQDYRCSVCGTEITLRVANLAESSPPKHCREEMVPVWRP
jgi:hypothetical protein